MNNKPNYANWVSSKAVTTLTIASAVFIALFALSFLAQGNTVILVIRVFLAILAILFVAMTIYMYAARKALSYEGGAVQGKVLDNVLAHLYWDGSGKLLDIGCGSGAMAIKAAKKFPSAQITGIDYWGLGWDYSKAQCENNAMIEGVPNKILFVHGDASKMDFEDETFDAAVSNFVFHEVRSQPDKFALLQECFRVLKPGAVFAFQDIFYASSHYGNPEEFVKKLSPLVSEIHFVDTRKSDFAPSFLNTPLILGQMGLIYGKK